MNSKQQKVEIVVEVHKYKISGEDDSRSEALLYAAEQAENILYNDILGALILDKFHRLKQYPQKEIHNEKLDCGGRTCSVEWQSNWHIPPYEYENGIEWVPLEDKKQKFIIQTIAQKTNDGKYMPLVELEAIIFNDERPGLVPGCLIDVICRNESCGTEAFTGKLEIDTKGNDPAEIMKTACLTHYKENLTDTHLFIEVRDPKTKRQYRAFIKKPKDSDWWHGDIGHEKVNFEPVNIKERLEIGKWRDR